MGFERYDKLRENAMGGATGGTLKAGNFDFVVDYNIFLRTNQVTLVSTVIFPIWMPSLALRARTVLTVNHAHTMVKEVHSGVKVKIDLA